MVKAELTIETQKDGELHLGLDLLKREDAQDEEWKLANIIQQLLLDAIKNIVEKTDAKLIKQEIIK